jgi:hypothetical protein
MNIFSVTLFIWRPSFASTQPGGASDCDDEVSLVINKEDTLRIDFVLVEGTGLKLFWRKFVCRDSWFEPFNTNTKIRPTIILFILNNLSQISERNKGLDALIHSRRRKRERERSVCSFPPSSKLSRCIIGLIGQSKLDKCFSILHWSNSHFPKTLRLAMEDSCLANWFKLEI